MPLSKKKVKVVPQVEEKKVDAADSEKIEDLKLVASLLDWSAYDKLMGKIFYEHFGKVLEQKVDEYQKTKTDLKAYIRENYANTRDIQTPRKAKPATALLEQISKFKALTFDSDDEVVDETLMDQTEQTHAPSNATPVPIDSTAIQIDSTAVPIDSTAIQNDSTAIQIDSTAVPIDFTTNQIDSTAIEIDNTAIQVDSTAIQADSPPVLMNSPPVSNNSPSIQLPIVPETPIFPTPRNQVPFTRTNQVPFTPTTPITPCTPKPKKFKMCSIGHANNKSVQTSNVRPVQVSNTKPVPAVSSSMRKLAILKTAQQPAHQPIRMPPLLNFTPMKTTTPSKSTPKKTPGLDSTFQKMNKLKEIDEKADQAIKARDEKLREKAERAKREREERAKRVEQNNKQREQARLEQENTFRKHLEAVKEYQVKEKQTPQKFNSPVVPRVFHPLGANKIMDKINWATTKPTNVVLKNQVPQIKQKSVTKSPQLVVAVEEVYFDEKENQEVAVEDEYLHGEEHSGIMEAEEGVNGSEVEQISMYDMTKEKIYLPSTENNYNVDDLSSGDETDNDEQPRKIVPRWASKENILKRTHEIRRLLSKDQIERHFGRIQQPTVQDLFKGYGKDFPPRRASSACWDSPMSDPTPGVGLYQSQFNTPSTSKVNIKKR